MTGEISQRDKIEAAMDEVAAAAGELAQAISELRRCHVCQRFTRPDPCRHCGAKAR